MQKMWFGFVGWEEALEKEMATDSSIPAGIIPRTEEHGVARVGHDLATKQQQMIIVVIQ